LKGAALPIDPPHMAIPKVDELRQRARSIMEDAASAESEAARDLLLDSAHELLERAGAIEQAWLEMLAGSEATAAP
jgi:hypothetical protein